MRPTVEGIEMQLPDENALANNSIFDSGCSLGRSRCGPCGSPDMGCQLGPCLIESISSDLLGNVRLLVCPWQPDMQPDSERDSAASCLGSLVGG